MRKQIRNLGAFLAILYVALFLQVNRLTVFEQDELQNKPGNNREVERDFNRPRGSVSTADGVVVAESVDAPAGSRFELQRQFPEGPRYAHITGYYGFTVGSAGLEDSYNDELAGRTDTFDLDDLQDLFVERERVGNLTLTVRDDVQRAAEGALQGRAGAVVALDPRTGGILAMYSNPTFDPNELSTLDTGAANLANQQLNDTDGNPKLSRAYQDRFSPGSTFKVVTATAGIEHGGVSRDQPDYPPRSEYSAPGSGSPIRNFGGSTCGGSLFEILQNSCNAAFAQMGAEDVGVDGMTETAEGFGFNSDVPIDLPPPESGNQVQSVFPDIPENSLPLLAQSSIGQFDVAATPLEMALVAAGVANGGEIMAPHVVQEVRDDEGEVVDEADEEVWTRAMDEATAGLMREAMQSVVADGSATALDDGLENFEVGGKTGTAQIGTSGRVNTWIIGFAGPPGEEPTVAVGVLVQNQEGVSEATGGRVAAPVGASVLAAALQNPSPADSDSNG